MVTQVTVARSNRDHKVQGQVHMRQDRSRNSQWFPTRDLFESLTIGNLREQKNTIGIGISLNTAVKIQSNGTSVFLGVCGCP